MGIAFDINIEPTLFTISTATTIILKDYKHLLNPDSRNKLLLIHLYTILPTTIKYHLIIPKIIIIPYNIILSIIPLPLSTPLRPIKIDLQYQNHKNNYYHPKGKA